MAARIESKTSSDTLKFEDVDLPLGTRLQITPRGSGRHFFSTLIGGEPGEYLVVKAPSTNGLTATLSAGEILDLRAFSGLSILTFAATIDSILSRPQNWLCLSYPSWVKSLALRTALRLNVKLAVTAAQITGRGGVTQTQGSLEDLSTKGALLSAIPQFGDLNDRVEVEFAIPVQCLGREVTIKSPAVIRNLRPSSQGQESRYGLEFAGMAQEEQQHLQLFLYEAALQKRAA